MGPTISLRTSVTVSPRLAQLHGAHISPPKWEAITAEADRLSGGTGQLKRDAGLCGILTRTPSPPLLFARPAAARMEPRVPDLTETQPDTADAADNGGGNGHTIVADAFDALFEPPPGPGPTPEVRKRKPKLKKLRFFLVFAGLKFLMDLGSLFPHKELDVEPPRWAKHLDRIKTPNGESFSEHWRRTELEQRRIREMNERVLPGG